MIAEVIINSTVKKLDRTFDYNVPVKLAGTVCVGSRVQIPFGSMKHLEEGFIIGFKEKSKYKLKDIETIQEGFCLSEENIELAKWMSRRYFCNLSDCIKMMLPPGTTTKVIKNRIREKNLKFIYLKKNGEELELEKIKSEKQLRAINFLKENDGILQTELEVFADISKSIINTLERNGYIEIIEKQVQRNPFLNKKIERDKELVLTNEQKIAYECILETMDKKIFKEFLIYGITGSGKTEIYLQLIKKALEKQQSSIILVPEISLTPQMVNRFIARFGERNIAVLHSKLSLGERYDEWQKINKKEAKIIIGARSAIFAPIYNLGLIIIDEEHDSSYKSEMLPRYNAKDIARYLAQKRNIPLVLGSATPEITTFYKAKKEESKLLTLTKRANLSNLPKVKVVDLRQEFQNGNNTMLSIDLYNAIKENLKRKKQTILFLNRRGFSTFIMCRDCGYTVKCKNCNISLTYHLKENQLKCHYCGYEQNNMKVCPECKSNKIKYFGTGTQKLEHQINKIFPEASTIRMDVDTVSKKNSHEEILEKFKNDNIDILIGTQMVVKGHHFPKVTLVGVIAADASLNIDDYRANERTFQILTQVAGRAGRENLQGNVIIQTYNPDNFSIECAKKQNYDMFYEREIILRRQLKYPPFCDIILFGISSTEEEIVKQLSNNIYVELINNVHEEEFLITKPMPAPIDKMKSKYRWRIIIKGKVNDRIVEKIQQILQKCYKVTNKARVVVDINPINML
ncbi:MAG: primosomal protein N' [Clostridia bacterium]|nr:primosomal protein N' [Clostridia bacterium]